MKRFLVIALLFFVFQLQAQIRIGETEAFATAKLFMQHQAKQQNISLSLNEVIGSKNSGQANLFVFTMEPRGFVILSATNEVLAYSLYNIFPSSDELPDHIAYWLDLYNDQTDYLLQHPEQQKVPSKNQNAVDPLLTSVWGQGCFHNADCPVEENGPCRHVSAGCVAIAMAQVMYYNKWPINGYGSISYKCPPYGTLSADFEHTTYNWYAMTDTLREHNQAVAKLVSHCGISVKMQYGAHESSATSSNAVYALQSYFSYPYSTLSKRSSYSNEAWFALIKDDLDKQRPVYYTGSSSLGSHAFVCDGYDHNGLFHFNFGWDGVADGYYTLDCPYGFSISQTAIHHIFPTSELHINSDEHGIIYVAQDGTGDGSSWEQATPDLQSAIFKAYINNCSVWVKEGFYQGIPEKEYAFCVLRICKLFGGFKGDEPYDYDLSQRDCNMYPSILDGNNVQGVIQVNTLSPNDTITIDGFTIQNGYAPMGGGLRLTNSVLVKNCKICHNFSPNNGGGLIGLDVNSGDLTVVDCEFFDNEARNNGGAIFDYGNATFLHCHIHDNISRVSGGGIFCGNDKSSQYINCTISNNVAKTGGGISCTDQILAFWNCLINNNTAEIGGGCYLDGTNTYYTFDGTNLFNCTIVKNEATEEFGGVYNAQSSRQNIIKNCIIWGNTSEGAYSQIGPCEDYSYCAVENDPSETGLNFDADPENDGELNNFYIRFNSPNIPAGNSGYGGDWALQSNSFCIDKGSDIADQPETDLAGSPRIRHRGIDLGTYETNTAAYLIETDFCEETPFYYNDSLLPFSGHYSFFYPGDSYDSVVFIHLKDVIVHMKEEICEDDTYNFFGNLLYEAGHYSFTIHCKTYELELTIKPKTITHLEKEICEGDYYDFFGALLSETGHYSTTVDCKTYELDLTVHPEPSVPVQMEESICEGESYNFFGQQLNSNGRYYHTLPDCKIYELELTVNPLPELHVSSDTTVEYGKPIILSVSGAESYLWSTGDTTQHISVIPKNDKAYSVVGVSQKGCSAMAVVRVQILKDNEGITLFPNPANDMVEIHAPLIDEVEILNLLGQRIDHILTNREAVEFDVSNYHNGVYIIHVREMNKHSYKKLIIQH